MRWLLIGILFTGGCASPSKIKKSYDEGYALGKASSSATAHMEMQLSDAKAQSQMYQDRLSNCLASNEQLRRMVDACQSANPEK